MGLIVSPLNFKWIIFLGENQGIPNSVPVDPILPVDRKRLGNHGGSAIGPAGFDPLEGLEITQAKMGERCVERVETASGADLAHRVAGAARAVMDNRSAADKIKDGSKCHRPV